MVERKNAMLTAEDRDYLEAVGEGRRKYTGEYADQERYNRRESIRLGVEDSLADFSRLMDAHVGDERGRVLNRHEMSDDVLGERVSFAVGFLYLLVGDADRFEWLAERGVRTALAQEGRLFSDVSLELEVEYTSMDVEDFLGALESDEELDDRAIFRFFRDRDPDDFTSDQLRQLEQSDAELVRMHAESFRDIARKRREYGLD